MDFGCGTGRSLSYFKYYFKNVKNFYGCDVSSESIKIASKIMPEAHLFVNESIEAYKKFFRGGSAYDLVFMACVLHHMEPSTRKKWMQTVINYLKPGGYLVVFEHNLKNPYTKKIVLAPDNEVDNIHYMLTRKELKSLLLESFPRMNIVWEGYTLFSLFRKMWIIQAEKLVKWCPLGAQHCMIVQKI